MLPTHLHVSEMTCDAWGWREVCIRMCVLSGGQQDSCTICLLLSKIERELEESSQGVTHMKRREILALTANCISMCVSADSKYVNRCEKIRQLHIKSKSFLAAGEPY